MLKGAPTNNRPLSLAKKGSVRKDYQGPLASGLSRRAFLKTTTAISLLAGLTACKPDVPIPDAAVNTTKQSDQTDTIRQQKTVENLFTSEQRKTLDAVQMHLFPEDGDGPSARDLNGVNYLDWAMSDQQNIDDGDPDFILRGIGWLDDLSQQTQGNSFVKLDHQQQDKVLKQIATSSAGENWLSILIYYLVEALTLDPIYGGNPNMIGWQWLQHQPGFPRPVKGKTYRDFE